MPGLIQVISSTVAYEDDECDSSSSVASYDDVDNTATLHATNAAVITDVVELQSDDRDETTLSNASIQQCLEQCERTTSSIESVHALKRVLATISVTDDLQEVVQRLICTNVSSRDAKRVYLQCFAKCGSYASLSVIVSIIGCLARDGSYRYSATTTDYGNDTKDKCTVKASSKTGTRSSAVDLLTRCLFVARYFCCYRDDDGINNGRSERRQDQLFAFRNNNGTSIGRHNDIYDIELIDAYMSLPKVAANACYKLQVSVPNWLLPTTYYTHLYTYVLHVYIHGSNSSNNNDDAQFVCNITKRLLQSRKQNDIAQALYTRYSRIEKLQGDDNADSRSSFDDQSTTTTIALLSKLSIPVRQIVALAMACIKLAASRMDWTVAIDMAVPADFSKLFGSSSGSNFLYSTCIPLLQSILLLRDSNGDTDDVMACFVEESVTSKQAFDSDRDGAILCIRWGHIIASVVLAVYSKSGKQSETTLDSTVAVAADHNDGYNDVNGKTNKASSSSLSVKLVFDNFVTDIFDDVVMQWSSRVFVDRVDPCHQKQVSQFIHTILVYTNNSSSSSSSRCETTLDGKDSINNLLSGSILDGVTVRLANVNDSIRHDGMRIASALASRLGQVIRFDDLTELDRQYNIATEKQPATQDDANDGSENVEEHKECQNNTDDNDNDNDNDSDTDADSVWSDELLPYDTKDDESDLQTVETPRYLRDCLLLLRAGEQDEDQHVKQRVAMRALPQLVRTRPLDLADYAISLTGQVLQTNNGTDSDVFANDRMLSIVALTVEEPLIVGVDLTQRFFHEGYSLTDRMNILNALCEATQELSGMRIAEKLLYDSDRRGSIDGSNNTGKSLNSIEQYSYNDATKKDKNKRKNTTIRRSGQRTTTILPNRFVSVCPFWFYTLVENFVKHKDNSQLWGGDTGTILLSGFISSLAFFLDSNGSSDTSMLSWDLLQLIWPFRNAQVVNVRAACLSAVASSVTKLSISQLESFIEMRALAELEDMERCDSDKSCRVMARSIVEHITVTRSQLLLRN